MQNKILRILKQANNYVSGEELGEQLGVSRTSIWKGIKKLRQEGYEIEAISNRGYLLHNSERLYNAEELHDGLQTTWLGQDICFQESVDSTNLWIRRLAEKGAKNGTVVVAETQQQGRGRLGKQWTSQAGVGIWMSLLLRPEISPNETPLLTLLTGLGVCKAIRNTTGLEATIKWPNDILVHGKKVCGILTELDAEMLRVNYVVVGIGVNVNTLEFPEELQNIATSLRIEQQGKEFIRKNLVQQILLELEKNYTQYLEQEDFLLFYQEYKTNCQTIGQEVHVLGKEPFFGIATDITPQGELIVRKEDGTETVVFSGEVSIRSKNN